MYMIVYCAIGGINLLGDRYTVPGPVTRIILSPSPPSRLPSDQLECI